MDADEDCVAVAIGYARPFTERDKDIAVARHDHPVAGLAQSFFEPLGDVERHDFFRDPLPGNSAAIETAVAGVDHHGGKFPARGPSAGSEKSSAKESAKSVGSEARRPAREKFAAIVLNLQTVYQLADRTILAPACPEAIGATDASSIPPATATMPSVARRKCGELRVSE